jgi:Protein of unknown function (DUF2971)
MRLFKYVGSKSAVLNMASGSLKFTPIGELNDPSEMIPVMDRDETRSSLGILRKNGLTPDQFKWLGYQGAILDELAPHEKVLSAPSTIAEANQMLAISVYDNLDHMEKKLFSTIECIRGKVGILSLSERYDSLPMWAHYANQAKGFVVVLENLMHCFGGDKTGSLNIPKSVDYAERFVGMTFDPRTQDRLFFSKLSDWSYEREWRVVTSLKACSVSAEKLYLRKVPPKHITGVICGWRVGKDEISSLRKDLQVNPSATLISAYLEDGKVKLRPSFE